MLLPSFVPTLITQWSNHLALLRKPRDTKCRLPMEGCIPTVLQQIYIKVQSTKIRCRKASLYRYGDYDKSSKDVCNLDVKNTNTQTDGGTKLCQLWNCIQSWKPQPARLEPFCQSADAHYPLTGQNGGRLETFFLSTSLFKCVICAGLSAEFYVSTGRKANTVTWSCDKLRRGVDGWAELWIPPPPQI